MPANAPFATEDLVIGSGAILRNASGASTGNSTERVLASDYDVVLSDVWGDEVGGA